MSKRFLLTTTVVLLLASGAAGAGLLPRSLESTRANASATGAKRSTPKGIKTVVAANNRFAFDLYAKLRASQKGNIFYSPYSVSAASAMIYEGARGKTASEMASVFHFPKSRVLRPNFAAIHNDLNKASSSYKLKTGNALWAQKSFRFLKTYTKTIKTYYRGKVANLNFAGDPESSRKVINKYIEKQTEKKIVDLIPSGLLTNLTRFVLTNAIYFKGQWLWQFDTRYTSDEDFRVSTDKIVRVPMMQMPPIATSFNYAATDDLQILELPYKGDKVSMLVLLPRAGLGSLEHSLTAAKLKAYKAEMMPTYMDYIAIPKFEFKSEYRLENVLARLGMRSAFSDNADFSRMTGKRDLMLNFVIHQAYVKVDEKGTEAAAATGGGGGVNSIRESTVFRADHPFIFLIQDNKSGNILFLGRVVNPAS
jgi:serine protease inhibitor